MNGIALRRALRGAIIVGGVFGLISFLQATRGAAPFPQVLEPLLAFSLLGATIGGLVGPLVGEAVARLRNRER